MDEKTAEVGRERSRRPIRNRRYDRRVFGEDKRPPKRLFTPEIKRFLKDWLIRRRDNPYPNRDEKKTLAVQTGLTYIQVCNWFANWRRKLKNAGKEPQKKSWGQLIKVYNSQVQGNVEHFSICSDDSIWGEVVVSNSSGASPSYTPRTELSFVNSVEVKTADHSYTSRDDDKGTNNNSETQCLMENQDVEQNPFAQHKYKSHIMEKYLRDCQKPEYREDDDVEKPSMISRWLESAVNFRPSEHNYLNWTLSQTHQKKNRKKASPVRTADSRAAEQHGREELDAAEALTRLASAHTAIKA